jgi:hypothetical protein
MTHELRPTTARTGQTRLLGGWARPELALAGQAVEAEAARQNAVVGHPVAAPIEPHDANWARLLHTSEALELLLGLGTARMAG